MKHNFKAALEWFNELRNRFERISEDEGVAIHPEQIERYETIRHALLLADKVTGEPSMEMKQAGGCVLSNGEQFKAMIEQAQREVEG